MSVLKGICAWLGAKHYLVAFFGQVKSVFSMFLPFRDPHDGGEARPVVWSRIRCLLLVFLVVSWVTMAYNGGYDPKVVEVESHPLTWARGDGRLGER